MDMGYADSGERSHHIPHPAAFIYTPITPNFLIVKAGPRSHSLAIFYDDALHYTSLSLQYKQENQHYNPCSALDPMCSALHH